MLNNQLALIFVTCAIANLSLLTKKAEAQIVPDGTLGNESSTVREDTVNGIDSDLIEGGANRGENLFHSFEEFNIDLGRGAYFANPAAIQNIFTRVTGSNASNLQGVLGVLGNADLFLINPNGIVFGDNASLDLNGSFFGSTADNILFDDLEFSATNPQAIPSVTINIPIGLGFRDEPGDINLAGNLTVNPEQTISLVGGDLNINSGQIDSPQSNIFLGSVTEAGIVDLDTSFTPNIPEDLTRGDIFLSNARVSVRGDIGGNITIDTGNLELSESSFILNGIESSNNPLDARAGDTNINATGRVTIADGSVISNLAGAETVGNAGNINIVAGSFELSDSPFPLDTSANGMGDAGDINITVQGDTLIQNADVFTNIFNPGTIGDGGDLNINVVDGSLEIINSTFFANNRAGTGDAGNITIAGTEIILDNSILDGRTDNIGDAGNVNVTADSLNLNNSSIFAGVSTGGEGNGGNIAIATNSLSLTQASLNATSGGEGDAGSVNVIANSILLDGRDSSISTVVSNASNMGNGGDIRLETSSLELLSGSTIVSGVNTQVGDSGDIDIIASDFIRLESDSLASSIENSTSSSNTGNTGRINIQAGSLDIFNGEIFSEVRGEGQGGGIAINVDDNIKLDGSLSNRISTVLSGSGEAGDITINARNLELSNGIRITSSISGNANGNAGDISLNIQDEIALDRTSGVFSDVLRGGVGNGGDININTASLRLTDSATINSRTGGEGDAGSLNLNITEQLELNNSEILANTGEFSTGEGGDVQLTTTSIVLNDDSVIGVNSLGAGDAGNIDLTTENLDLENDSLISAATVSGEGGNLTFNLDRDLVLDNSAIETEAGGSGNGGNITTNAEFIILENSSFIANAFEGNGGNIDLTIQNLFTTLDSTISASSQFGIDGIIEINTPDVDPSQGVIELPQTVVDPDRLIAENACKQGTNSQFYLTGRGGLPPSPNSSLDTKEVDIDLIEPVATNNVPSQAGEQLSTTNPQNVTSASIVPARGWIKNERGEVLLISYDPDNRAIARDREFIGSCNRK